MKDEIASLKKSKTWILVKRPSDKKLVGYKWFYKLKEGNSDVQPTRYKARLVAEVTQREGVNFNEVFSPIIKHSSIRVLLAIIAYFDLELNQLDIKTAFFHRNLDKEILMIQLKGFIKDGTKHGLFA